MMSDANVINIISGKQNVEASCITEITHNSKKVKHKTFKEILDSLDEQENEAQLMMKQPLAMAWATKESLDDARKQGAGE